MFFRPRTTASRKAWMSGENIPSCIRSVRRKPLAAEAANRQRGGIDRHGRKRGIDSAAVGEPRIDHRRAFVDPSSDSGGDPLDDPHQVVCVSETNVGLLQASETFHIDLLRAVDENVGDRRIGHQRRQRSHPQRFFQQVAYQPATFVFVQRQVLDLEGFIDERLDEFGQRLLAGRQQVSPVEFIQQPLVQGSLDGKVFGAARTCGLEARREPPLMRPRRSRLLRAFALGPPAARDSTFRSRCRQSCSASGDLRRVVSARSL